MVIRASFIVSNSKERPMHVKKNFEELSIIRLFFNSSFELFWLVTKGREWNNTSRIVILDSSCYIAPLVCVDAIGERQIAKQIRIVILVTINVCTCCVGKLDSFYPIGNKVVSPFHLFP